MEGRERRDGRVLTRSEIVTMLDVTPLVQVSGKVKRGWKTSIKTFLRAEQSQVTQPVGNGMEGSK